MPVEVDLPELLAINTGASLCPRRALTVRPKHERFPRRPERLLVLAVRPTEHECAWTQPGPALQDGRESALRIERHASILRVLSVRAGNGELMPFPVYVPVLDAEHLAFPAAGPQRAYDAVVHRCASLEVFLGVEH